jgi:flagellar protein FliO/FliZ
MESHDILRFISAFVLVISLMGGLWLVLKKMGINGGLTLQQGKKRRLKIVEILPLTSNHKAVLLRRDDKEHLVILGTNGQTVVEQSIHVQDDNHDL